VARILLVEDNEMNRDMLARRLRARGFEVDLAFDGAMGIERVSETLPDLVLMDMSLPKVDGWEATRRIKADPATRSIPVVALTAHAMVTDRDTAMDAGCDEYETKPVDLARLLEKIALLLSRPEAAP
jgi:two-component system cell cycle response regulator DivK